MLEDRDYQEIFHMFKVIVESDIGPKLNKLAEGQQVLLETLAPRVYLKTPNAPGHIMSFQIHPKNRVEELEDEVSFLKSLIRMHSEQIAELKKKIGA